MSSSPPPEPQSKPSKSFRLRLEIAGLILSLAVALGAPDPGLLPKAVALVVALVLGVLLALFADVPEFRFIKIVRRVLAGAWLIIMVVAIYRLVSTGATSQENVKQLLSKRAVNGLVPILAKADVRMGNLADEQGRVVLTIPILSILDDPVNATIYGTIKIHPYINKPLAERTAEIMNEVQSLKSLTHDKYSQRQALTTIRIDPSLAGDNSQVNTFQFAGDEVSAADWDDIVNGRKYIYLYVMVAINDDPNKGTPICAIVDGLQHPPDICPPGSDSW